MEKEIVEELTKKLKWYEKGFIKLHRKLFIKIYKQGIKQGFKWAN